MGSVSDKLHIDQIPTSVRAKGFTAASWTAALQSYKGYCRACAAVPVEPREPMDWIQALCGELERRVVPGRSRKKAAVWLYELRTLLGESGLERELERMRLERDEVVAGKRKTAKEFADAHNKLIDELKASRKG